MRDTAYVPELEEDSSARLVDCVSDASPAGHLLDAVDAWSVGISHAFAQAAHRQSLAVAKSPHAKQDQSFVDAISAWNEE